MMTRKNRKVSKNFGKFLKELREVRGYSLMDVQNQTGISASYLNRIERCEKLSPTLPVIYSLAKFYDVPIFSIVSIALNIDDDEMNDLAIFENIVHQNGFVIRGKIASSSFKRVIVELVEYILNMEWTGDSKMRDMLELSEKIDAFRMAYQACESAE